MLSVHPSIDPRIAELTPGFRAVSVVVEAAPIVNPGVAAEAMERAYQVVEAGTAHWADAHLAAWGDAFRKFGVKPQRTPCSAEALLKRVKKDGKLPTIDPVVDLYNAISIQYAIPVGGENFAAYVGMPRLTIADGSEEFDTMKSGELANEPPDAGEVIWRDDQGVTCRRWNWRQGVRTRLDANAKQMWFILESLPEMPIEALNAAADDLVTGLSKMMPDAVITSELVEV
ncbi:MULTISPECIES: B3/B4 domain-containing protein [Pseudomonas]|uniref:B3/B4 domain-containing protein n=1 Tax=Pseudomonas TaxID=286 RepID=UPI0039882827